MSSNSSPLPDSVRHSTTIMKQAWSYQHFWNCFLLIFLKFTIAIVILTLFFFCHVTFNVRVCETWRVGGAQGGCWAVPCARALPGDRTRGSSAPSCLPLPSKLQAAASEVEMFCTWRLCCLREQPVPGDTRKSTGFQKAPKTKCVQDWS